MRFRILATLSVLLLSAPSALGVQRALAPTRGDAAGWLAAVGIELAYLSLAFAAFEDQRRQRLAVRVARAAVLTAITLNVLADYAARVPEGLSGAATFTATFDWLLLALAVLESAPLATLAYTLATLLHTHSSSADAEQHSAIDAGARQHQHTAQHSAAPASASAALVPASASAAEHPAEHQQYQSTAQQQYQHPAEQQHQQQHQHQHQQYQSTAQQQYQHPAEHMLQHSASDAQSTADAQQYAGAQHSAPAASASASAAQHQHQQYIADAAEHMLQHSALAPAAASAALVPAPASTEQQDAGAEHQQQHPAQQYQSTAQQQYQQYQHPAQQYQSTAQQQYQQQHPAALSYRCPRCGAALTQQQYGAAKRYGYCGKCKGK